MKAKYILLALFTIGLAFNAEAQFLKKLKKKAEQAAERTVIRKTEQLVTQQTEKTIDDVAQGKGNTSGEDNEEAVEEQGTVVRESSGSQGIPATPGGAPMMGGNTKKTAAIPEVYEFDWEFKTKVTASKDQEMDINYLINSKTLDYFGMEMSTEELKKQGKTYMVMDSENKSSVLFMAMQGQHMAQVHKIPEPKKGKDEAPINYTEIGTKEILGFTCYGIQIEDKTHIGTLYFTLDAPVNFSAFFAMANNKSAPKGFDPALLQVLKEDALLMEMNMTHKKKKNESFTMTAVSLDKKPFQLRKKDYQFLNMGF